MKLQLSDLRTNAGHLTDDVGGGVGVDGSKVGLGMAGLGMDISITTWPDIVLEVSDQFYTVIW